MKKEKECCQKGGQWIGDQIFQEHKKQEAGQYMQQDVGEMITECIHPPEMIIKGIQQIKQRPVVFAGERRQGRARIRVQKKVLPVV